MNLHINSQKLMESFKYYLTRLIIPLFRERTIALEIFLAHILMIYGVYMNIFIYYNRGNRDQSQQLAIQALEDTWKYAPLELWGAVMVSLGLGLLLASTFDILRVRSLLNLIFAGLWLYIMSLQIQRFDSFFGSFTIFFYFFFLVSSIWAYFSSSYEARVLEEEHKIKVTFFVSKRFLESSFFHADHTGQPIQESEPHI